MGSAALANQVVAERKARLVVVDGEGGRTIVALAEGRPCGSCGVMAMLMINRLGRSRCASCDRENEAKSAVVGLMGDPSAEELERAAGPRKSVFSRKLSVQVDADEPTEVFEADWARDNDEDFCVTHVAGLKKGETGVFGGGASPSVRVTVLS